MASKMLMRVPTLVTCAFQRAAQLNKKDAAVLLWFVSTGLLTIGVFLTDLASFLVLEASEGLPVIVYSAIFSFAAIDLLVPNPRMKGSRGLMWLYWESIEHLGFPVLFLAFSAIFSAASPPLFQVAICSIMFVLYGFVFGKAETGKDLAKTVALVNLLLAFWSLPTFMLWLDFSWGVKGILTWSLLSASTLLAYSALKRMSSQSPSRVARRLLKKSVAAATSIIVVLTLFLSPATCTEEKRVLLEHNVPHKIQVGLTATFKLQFTDQSGTTLEPDTVTVTVTNPFGLETRPSLEHTGVGAYAFTQTFDTEGAYYITVRASKYAYISYSNRFLVDCVKSRVFLDWLLAVLNSPALFVLVIAPISVLLLYRRFRKKRKK